MYSQHKHKQLLSRNKKASRSKVITKKNWNRTQPTVYSFIIRKKNTENGQSSVTLHSDLTKEFFSFEMSVSQWMRKGNCIRTHTNSAAFPEQTLAKFTDPNSI